MKKKISVLIKYKRYQILDVLKKVCKTTMGSRLDCRKQFLCNSDYQQAVGNKTLLVYIIVRSLANGAAIRGIQVSFGISF